MSIRDLMIDAHRTLYGLVRNCLEEDGDACTEVIQGLSSSEAHYVIAAAVARLEEIVRLAAEETGVDPLALLADALAVVEAAA